MGIQHRVILIFGILLVGGNVSAVETGFGRGAKTSVKPVELKPYPSIDPAEFLSSHEVHLKQKAQKRLYPGGADVEPLRVQASLNFVGRKEEVPAEAEDSEVSALPEISTDSSSESPSESRTENQKEKNQKEETAREPNKR